MSRRSKRLSVIAFPLFIALILLCVWLFRSDFVLLYKNREALRSWIRAREGWGFLAFIGLQALQVFLFVLPGEAVQVVGGYIFGFWLSSALSLIGIAIGSVANFYVGRSLGRSFVETVFKKERVERLERLASSGRGAAGFFLFFLIPGLPKDALCYVAGMSRLSLPLFLAVSMAGRLPGILGSAFMGSATASGSYKAALIVLGVAALLFLAGLIWKEKLEALIERLVGKKTDKP
jgi:uncharacterized membrane protein YdjX (TVP38/TMEM64 family)